jgi:hypothetical protein
LVAGVGAVVTACQRVGIRSHVQRLSRPNRGERRQRRRRRGQRAADGTTNGETTAVEQNGAEHSGVAAEPEAVASTNGSGTAQEHTQPKPVESSHDTE